MQSLHHWTRREGNILWLRYLPGLGAFLRVPEGPPLPRLASRGGLDEPLHRTRHTRFHRRIREDEDRGMVRHSPRRS